LKASSGKHPQEQDFLEKFFWHASTRARFPPKLLASIHKNERSFRGSVKQAQEREILERL
jgi:hypothetical protein